MLSSDDNTKGFKIVFCQHEHEEHKHYLLNVNYCTVVFTIPNNVISNIVFLN